LSAERLVDALDTVGLRDLPPPRLKLFENRLELLPQVGDAVLHFRRDDGVDGPGHESPILQGPQGLGEHLLSDVGEAASQVHGAFITALGERFVARV